MQKLYRISAAIFNNSYYHDKLSLHGLLTNKFNTNAEYGGNYDNYHKLNQAKQSEEEFEAVFYNRHKYDRLKDYKNLMYCISDHVVLFYKSEKMSYYIKSIIHYEMLKLSYYDTAKRRARREQYET